MPKLHERLFERIREVPSAFESLKRYLKKLREETREKLRKDPSYVSRLKSLFKKEYIENITEPSDMFLLLSYKYITRGLLEDAQRDVERLYWRHRLNEVGIPLEVLLSAPIDYGNGRSVSNPLLDQERKRIFKMVNHLYTDVYIKVVIYQGLLVVDQLNERGEPLINIRARQIAEKKSKEANKFTREKFGIDFTTLYQVANSI